ncbi:hypothetical protein HI914_05306 [Erysiphe necator]|nr:hypothetical protein HI914_05306 [Erysiphe necator]
MSGYINSSLIRQSLINLCLSLEVKVALTERFYVGFLAALGFVRSYSGCFLQFSRVERVLIGRTMKIESVHLTGPTMRSKTPTRPSSIYLVK